MDEHSEPRYEVLSPLPRKVVSARDGAPRLPDLNGRTICELWDGIFRGEIIYPRIRAALQRRFPGVRFVGHEAFGNVYGPRERDVVASLPERLREHGCDAAIVGIGA